MFLLSKCMRGRKRGDSVANVGDFRVLLAAFMVANHAGNAFSFLCESCDQFAENDGFLLVVGDAVIREVVDIIKQGQDGGF